MPPKKPSFKLPPALEAKYIINRELGQGAYGIVW
jgi:hypothetical protein